MVIQQAVWRTGTLAATSPACSASSVIWRCSSEAAVSVAMPPAEIRAIVPPGRARRVGSWRPRVVRWRAAARAASANADVGTNAGLVPASVDAADQSANSGQDDGDIPPVLGKVAW